MTDAVRRPRSAAIGLALVVLAISAIQPPAVAGHSIPGFERFMDALGQIESSGRYDAYNASSGAYGKYQIIPSSWRAWAREVLGDPDAPKTPANQEKVARYKVHQIWHRTEKYRQVAHWWLTGRIQHDESTWSRVARTYVNKVMKAYNETGSVSGGGGGGGGGADRVARYQETYRYIRWTGTWGSARHGSYAGDHVRWSKEAGATAIFRFEGNSIAWFGPKGPTRGQAKLFLDGRYLKTIDLYASGFRAVNRLFSTSFASAGIHVLTIEVVGTRGRPVVAIDEFRVGKED